VEFRAQTAGTPCGCWTYVRALRIDVAIGMPEHLTREKEANSSTVESRRGAVPHKQSSPLTADRTGRADFPHPALRLASPRACGERPTPASCVSPPRLGFTAQLARKASGTTRCFTGLRQVTHRSLLQQAHQKSGPFPPPALPSFIGTATLSDSRVGRRLTAPLSPLPSPSTGLPPYAIPCLDVLFPLPRWTAPSASVGCFPRACCLPRTPGGSASTTSLRGLLRLHSRYGPSIRSAAYGDVCRRASILPVAQLNRLPATGQPTIARVGLPPTR
jgi:hypothetical protein